MVLIPYISLNSTGKVLKAVNEINGQIGFICFGLGTVQVSDSVT